MNEMSVEQMALLNALMYYDIEYNKNYTIGDLITILRDNDEKWNDVLESNPGAMSDSKTKNVLDAIMYDSKLRNLEVINTTTEEADKKGPLNVCFIDRETKNAIFAFRGTNGREWLDNAEGFLKESSLLQKDALRFFENTIKDFKLKENGYAIDVTGHSKGGNKAQYITIKSPDVRKCYSFEGQGFSKEFMEENYFEIRERNNKITTYAADMDYVNPLGYDIADNHIFYETNKPKNNILDLQYTMPVLDRLLSHSPGAYIHFENGKVKMNNESKQSRISQELNKMSIKMMQCPMKDKYGYFMSLMGVLQYTHSKDPITEEHLPSKKEIRIGLKDTLKFMMNNGASKGLLRIIASPCLDTNNSKNYDKMSSFMPYKIDIDKVNNDPFIKGKVAITFDDKIKIEDLMIVVSEKENLTVAYPQFKNGLEYEPYFIPTDKRFDKELNNNIIDAYENGNCDIKSDKPAVLFPKILDFTDTGINAEININHCLKIEGLKINDNNEVTLPEVLSEGGINKSICSIIDKESKKIIQNELEEQYNDKVNEVEEVR